MTNTTNTIEVTTLQVAEHYRAMIEDLNIFKNTTVDGEYHIGDDYRLYSTSLSKVTQLNDVDEENVSYLLEIRENNDGGLVFRVMIYESGVESLENVYFPTLADVIVTAD
ncbi:hypothetical protein [Lysinibacillus fusiformis]|uniref:hypothetical protein n=1 Tax=Lysinibacillus fusiformis TaxID=28031 RepID=UPI003D04325C